MIESLKNTVSWVQQTIQTRSGAGIIGLIIGAVIGGVYPYKMYELADQHRIRADTIIAEKDMQIRELNGKVLNSSMDCMETMERMLNYYKKMEDYFVSTRQMVNEVSTKTNKALNEQKQVLNEVKRIATPCEQ